MRTHSAVEVSRRLKQRELVSVQAGRGETALHARQRNRRAGRRHHVAPERLRELTIVALGLAAIAYNAGRESPGPPAGQTPSDSLIIGSGRLEQLLGCVSTARSPPLKESLSRSCGFANRPLLHSGRGLCESFRSRPHALARLIVIAPRSQ